MSLSDIDARIDPGSHASAGSINSGTNTNTNAAALKDNVVNNASAAANAVKDHPITQSVTNGPVAQSVKGEAAQTSKEFDGLAQSRQKPASKAATGQSLTNYHSFFYTLLSWEKPRATAITFAASIAFIFACRYLPVFKWALKVTWMTLGVVSLAEIAAKGVMGSSVATSVRPRAYYKIPKENLEASLDDLEQFINFFVIEVQRIVFAENVPVTVMAFLSAFVSYYLIKILPFWGLSLLFTCIMFTAPLIYVQNKELIDGQIQQASNLIQEQTAQVKDITAQQTSKGFESIKSYTNDATAKATDLVGSARQKIPSSVSGSTTKPAFNETDFPSAPATTLPSTAEHTKPVVHAPASEKPGVASNIYAS